MLNVGRTRRDSGVPALVVCILAMLALMVGRPHATHAQDSAANDHAVVEALLRLPDKSLSDFPAQRPAVLRYLSRQVGTQQYIDVAKRLKVFEQTDELRQMLTQLPFSTLNKDAAELIERSGDLAVLEAAIQDSNPELATAAVTAMGFSQNSRVIRMLKTVLEDPQASRQLRIAAADGLGRSEEGSRFLLEMAKQGQVSDDIRFVVHDRLLGANSQAIRNEAKKHLAAIATAEAEALPPVQELAKMRGDLARGKQVFHTVGTCIKCHQVGSEGKEVGPNLSEIGSKLSREDMYVAILNPSAAISHNYETYTLLDADDRLVTGLLINQTDEQVTIRDAEGIDHTRAAADVESLKLQTVSLMPADLQKAMSLQNLVDLVDYLLTLKRAGEGPFEAIAEDTVPANTDLRDPKTAIAGFDIAQGLQVELFAAEPQLLSPTSIDVDALGRVWVCEAVNYRHFRNPDNEARSQGDRILVLEDSDGDGKADKETVFYQDPEIDSPHGVCVLGDKIIVSAGENVFEFTDADGDLKPDSKKILFSGISGVQHDHGIHAFGIGPDGKLYFNFGNEGKQLKGPQGETIVDKAGNVVDDTRNPYQQGMVFRCNLDGSELETLGWNFRNNWEVCVDSFGNLWQSDNDDDGNRGTRINFVMEFGNYGYRDELTGDAWRKSRIGLEDEIPLQHWHLNDPGVVPNILQTGAGSPTGICFYEGDLLPEPFQNQIIHTDPGPNVVRAYPVENDGAGFQASILNLVKGVRDPWFRPVDVCVAPDGSLFVADWYDPGVGGHRMGDTQHGRIFRITPQGHEGYAIPVLDLESPAGTVRALSSPNLATQYLAQRRLQELGLTAVDALEDSISLSHSESIKARALWQLARISQQPAKYVAQAIADESPELRIVGIRMARQHDLDVIPIVEQLKNDDAPHVLRELLIALRHQQDPRAASLWADLAVRHNGRDRWYVEALGIAADKQWDEFFEAWLDRVGDDWNTPAGHDIIWRCRSPKACRYLAEIIRQCESEQEQYRYFRAFDFHTGPAKYEVLAELVQAGG